MDKFLKIIYGLVLACSIVCAFYYTTSSVSGTSYVNDKYAQFDERIALLEVHSILHPGDAKHFVFYVISGQVLFYGRVMMVTDAIVSYIPDKIWGIEGQVVATRLTHFFILLLAFHLLITLFVKDNLMRVLVFLFMLVSPYFIYFSFVPKPEPFVLLFLALFLKGFIKSNWSFGKHFIWLGIAFGCKMSVLPLIPIFFLLPAVYQNQTFQFVFKTIDILKSLMWLLVGFLACIPCLILIPVKPVFLQTYLYQTLNSASKPYDNSSIHFGDWLHHIIYKYYSIFPLLLVAVLVLVLMAAIYLLVVERKISNSHLLIGIGLVQVLLICLLTQRIWAHYLFVGLGLTFIAGFSFFETLLGEKLKWGSLLLLVIILPQSYNFASDAQLLSKRDNQQQYIQVKQRGEAAFSYLQAKGVHSIVCDISVYIPNKLVAAAERYEPFPENKKGTDLRILQLVEYGDALYTSGHDAIIFEKNCPCDSAGTFSDDFSQKEAVKSFLKHVPAVYHLDTAFADTKVYLKNEIKN